MVHTCSAYGCSNRFKKGSGIGFFRFPKDGSRLIQWLLALRRKNFIPTSDRRLCGEHFITGRPSLNPNHPDYVPTIFSFKNVDKKKGGSKSKKQLCDATELPILNCNNESEELDSEDDEAEEDLQIKPEPNLVPELINSSLVSVETVKSIINLERSDSHNLSPDFVGKSRRSKNLFTFVDLNGQILGRFSQKRSKKYTRKLCRHSLPIPRNIPVETVQVIIDKKRAQTVSVDKRTLCTAKNKESCKCKNRNDKPSVADTENDFCTIQVKVEPNSDENEDMDYLYEELKSLEQQKNELEGRINDELPVQVACIKKEPI